jgi:hypothetical protein
LSEESGGEPSPVVRARGASPRVLLIVPAVFLALIAFGTVAAFPEWDDAYLVLFLREASPEALAAAHPNRPLHGQMLRASAALFGLHPLPYAVLNVLLWALLAWQTARLAKRLVPGDPGAPFLAVLLVLSPVLVKIQYTTVTGLLPVNLPVSLCLGALLLALGPTTGRTRLIAGAMVLLATLVSEYGLATTAAAAAVLVLSRRRRAAAELGAASVIGYSIFVATADLAQRSVQDPTSRWQTLRADPVSVLFRFVEGVWNVLAGGWAKAIGDMRLTLDAKSTVLAVVFGAAVALVCARWSTREVRESGDERYLGMLVAAVAAGILPVVLSSRQAASFDPYESRYLLPVLPFSALALAAGLRGLSTARGRPFVDAAAGLVAGYWAIAGAYEGRARQADMQAMGEALFPLVQAKPGITVAVIPDYWKLEGSDLTPKVTWRWSDAEAKRLWVIPEAAAIKEFGPRGACRDVHAVDMTEELLSTGRRGDLADLVWVPGGGRGGRRIEPYCLGRSD